MLVYFLCVLYVHLFQLSSSLKMMGIWSLGNYLAFNWLHVKILGVHKCSKILFHLTSISI